MQFNTNNYVSYASDLFEHPATHEATVLPRSNRGYNFRRYFLRDETVIMALLTPTREQTIFPSFVWNVLSSPVTVFLLQMRRLFS